METTQPLTLAPQVPTTPHRLLQELANDTSMWLVFVLVAGAGASVLALGVLLRSNEKLTTRVVLGTLFHSLAWGVAVFLMTNGHAGLDLPMVLGLSILSGMGTASFIDLVLLLVKQRIGIRVVVEPPSANPTTTERPHGQSQA